MLLIRTTVAPSTIHGLGLFAAEPITKGAAIWRFSPGLDLEISPADFEKFTRYEQDIILFYGFNSRKTGKYHLSFDDVRFMNHADPGNVTVDEGRGTEDDVEFVLVAARDIAVGDELTQNYYEFDDGHRM
jgi:SET domain-containing protein